MPLLENFPAVRQAVRESTLRVIKWGHWTCRHKTAPGCWLSTVASGCIIWSLVHTMDRWVFLSRFQTKSPLPPNYGCFFLKIFFWELVCRYQCLPWQLGSKQIPVQCGFIETTLDFRYLPKDLQFERAAVCSSQKCDEPPGTGTCLRDWWEILYSDKPVCQLCSQ